MSSSCPKLSLSSGSTVFASQLGGFCFYGCVEQWVSRIHTFVYKSKLSALKMNSTEKQGGKQGETRMEVKWKGKMKLCLWEGGGATLYNLRSSLVLFCVCARFSGQCCIFGFLCLLVPAEAHSAAPHSGRSAPHTF